MQNKKTKLYRISAMLIVVFLLAGVLLGIQQNRALANTVPQMATDDPTPEPEALLEEGFHQFFHALQTEFETPQDVTKTCLSCHPDAAEEIQHTTHWTWEFVNETTEQVLGKKTLVNNFCININSNEPRCTSCHVGYGWTDNTYDFTVQENVDCLVCHDTTGTYKKFPTAAGYPVTEPKEFPPGSGKIWEPPDFTYIAQNVGTTSRETCGACHFFGGGGDEVKHGDLDSSLAHPSFDLDVHMDADGLNFSCTTCHETENHDIAGSRYSMDLEQWDGCESCHTAEPHSFDILNGHTDRITCQTCHIPEYARGDMPTKMFWDWSKAGELNEDGSIKVVKDEHGHVIYDSRKGEFAYEENVVPDYVWFNGSVSYTLLGDEIDPSGIVPINEFDGDINDPNAKIWPTKKFTAIIPYDSGNNTLVTPHLFGKDDAAYWGNYDWATAIAYAMEYAGVEFSGQYDFIETTMLWPTTHMVAPASESLNCIDCHSEEEGRLDFAALGYSEEESHRLTNFPPALSIEMLDAPHNSPTYCAGCHSEQLTEDKLNKMTETITAQLANQQAGEDLSDEEIQEMAESMVAKLAEEGGHYEMWSDSIHSENGVGCVSCHTLEGEGEHPMNPFSVNKDATVCGACHLEEYHDWQHSAHANPTSTVDDISCVDCHEPHQQEMRISDSYQTTCENCHKEQSENFSHSTHLGVAELDCLACHKNTELNTGHSFNVASDTCISCHEETIHEAGRIFELSAGEPVHIDEESDAEESADEHETISAQQGANIGISTPGILFIGGIIGAGIYWVVTGREPGAQHQENNKKKS